MGALSKLAQETDGALVCAGPTGLVAIDADDDAVVLGGGDGAAERAAGISHLDSPDELLGDRAAEPTDSCHCGTPLFFSAFAESDF